MKNIFTYRRVQYKFIASLNKVFNQNTKMGLGTATCLTCLWQGESNLLITTIKRGEHKVHCPCCQGNNILLPENELDDSNLELLRI